DRVAVGALRAGRCDASSTPAVAGFLVRSDYRVPCWRPTNSGVGIMWMESGDVSDYGRGAAPCGVGGLSVQRVGCRGVHLQGRPGARGTFQRLLLGGHADTRGRPQSVGAGRRGGNPAHGSGLGSRGCLWKTRRRRGPPRGTVDGISLEADLHALPRTWGPVDWRRRAFLP